MPAEIVVLLDSEDNPSLPKRLRPRGLRPLELPGQSTGELWLSGTPCAKGLRWAGVLRSPRLKTSDTEVFKVLKFFPFSVAPVIEQGNKKPRGQRWKESPENEPARKKRSRHMTKTLDPDPGEGMRGAEPGCNTGAEVHKEVDIREHLHGLS